MQDTKDTVVKLGNSLVQHGKHSDRVYVMSIDPEDMPELADRVIRLAQENAYSKIFAKVPESLSRCFDRRFITEAKVPGFFRGQEQCLFISKYLDPLREKIADKETSYQVLELVNKKAGQPHAIEELGHKWVIRKLDYADAQHAAAVYQLVFATYPFPIHDPGYIQQTMQENVSYYGVYYDIELVALASAEMDVKQQNTEMTDFATLPEHQGNHLALHLLRTMEREVRDLGIKTSYTIARALSVGMNLSFARCLYIYAGTLFSNTNISGGIESMNVWYKHLRN